MKLTPEHAHRLHAEWSKIAEGDIAIELIGGVVYAFGSELETLRLLKAHRETKHTAHDFSVARGSWFFRWDPTL